MNESFFNTVIFFITFTSCIHSLSFGTTLSSDNNSNNPTDTTYSCTLITISGSVFDDVNIFGLGDSSVKILKKDTVREIRVMDIKSIKFYRRGFWTGAAIGAGVAFGIGLLGGKGYTTGDGQQDYSFGNVVLIGTILAVPLGLIGGGIGVLFSEDHLYVLNKSNFEVKRKKVAFLIKEYSDR